MLGFHWDPNFVAEWAVSKLSFKAKKFISSFVESKSIVTIRVARSSEKSGKFLKFEHLSDFLLTF
jgi:hypothetical protein